MQTTFDLSVPVNISAKVAKPFMKWAGGKTQLIDALANLFPFELKSGSIKKYVEPFIGGGALFFYVAKNYPSIKSFFISDVNEELILAYKTIQKDVESLISLLTVESTYEAT
ncbi:MAG: DNA adenine methylase [Chloroflexota bacterium]